MILVQQVKASCFNNDAVLEAMEAAAALDECFESDNKPCLSNVDAKGEMELNSFRLAPYDTSTDNFMEKATGTVALKVGNKTVSIGNATKISRCHIVTSAHNLFKFGAVPANAEDVDVNFKSGQYCDSDRTQGSTKAKVTFRMVEEGNGKDFVCAQKDESGRCLVRQFYGKNDSVVLKLSKFDKHDKNFFPVNASALVSIKEGQKLNCWAYVNGKMFFMQKNAQIFGKTDRGVITNAVSQPGMSGGGCALASDPKVLVAMYANGNSGMGLPRVKIDPKNPVAGGANYLTDFNELDKRMYSKTGMHLADLDADCDKE